MTQEHVNNTGRKKTAAEKAATATARAEREAERKAESIAEPIVEKPKKMRRVRVRALQPMFCTGPNLADQRIVDEGEVFIYEGTELPTEDICVRVSDDVPLGKPPINNEPLKVAPSWTTKGFVDQANRETGGAE